MKIDKDENLSSKEEIERKEKNLVVKGSQELGLATYLHHSGERKPLLYVASELLIYNHVLDLIKEAKNLEELQKWITRERNLSVQKFTKPEATLAAGPTKEDK